ncbi:Retrovirus-related Pol polyprotein from transposon RE1 [Vitis vinifera]|uniref:Retrovirus-related Pol polyprotein from transposon RE1 n=1 Tax=Vitis vinifera TaxID=29760 RepID=A0A438H0A7_VITVI|nr:Retrovirus-related Pol polyprotein from transposon RE1 [Vitis vinifera]
MFLFTTPSMLIVLVYVDDIIVTGTSSQLIHLLIKHFHSSFALKELEPLHYFLGIQVSHVGDSIHLCLNEIHPHDLLKRADMFDNKLASTHMSSDTLLSMFDDEPLSNPTSYRQIVGALQCCT